MSKPLVFLNSFKSSHCVTDTQETASNTKTDHNNVQRKRSRVGKLQFMKELRGFTRSNPEIAKNDHLSCPSSPAQTFIPRIQPSIRPCNENYSDFNRCSMDGMSSPTNKARRKTSHAIHSIHRGCSHLAANVTGRRILNTATLPLHVHEDSTSIDVVSINAPPNVAIRYGDHIRLYAKSEYASSCSAAGYAGTFELERRFFTPHKENAQRLEKQNGCALACIPPIQESNASLFKPSTFKLLSKSGLEEGMPLSYGDLFILVDEEGKVWNNKIGTGPSTLSGHFGPKEQNNPGEMYLSFFQMQKHAQSTRACYEQEERDSDALSRATPRRSLATGEAENFTHSTSSEFSSDDEEDESFLSFAAFARNTKLMAENTFKAGRSMEDAALASALHSTGKLVYYGDQNVIIEIADSNRMRSKFNRVITHYRKNNEGLAVQGGYLRCDGRGNLAVFELHGLPLPPITSMEIIQSRDTDDKENEPTNHSMLSTQSLCDTEQIEQLQSGQSVKLSNISCSSLISLQFQENSMTLVPCERFFTAQEASFFVIVRGGVRPYRLELQAKRCNKASGHVPGRVPVLKGISTSRYISLVIAVFSIASYLYPSYWRTLQWMEMALWVSALLLLSLLVQLVQKEKAALDSDTASLANILSSRDWQLTLIAWEASNSERTVLGAWDQIPTGNASVKVPASFLVAENGDVTKAAERYEATLQWRQEVNADKILQVPHSSFLTIKSFYRQCLHKRDRYGHPVYFEKLASINMRALQRAGLTLDDLYYHYLFNVEFIMKYVASDICACSACYPSKTRKLLIVLDARGIGMREVSGEFLEFVRKSAGMMQRHYPQRSFKIMIINVPSWFGMVWKGMKGFLNEATRQKTNILTESESVSALLQLVDKDQLPIEYGGSCQCPGGCELNSEFAQLQRSLVDSVLASEPFCPDIAMGALTIETEEDEEKAAKTDLEMIKHEPLRLQIPTTAFFMRQSIKRNLYVTEPSALSPENLRSPAFPQEILRVGFLLKRSVKRKHFNPIWHRRLFILHPTLLRFARSVISDVVSVLVLTSDTIVRKSHKANNTFELITPLMEASGQSLLLYAPSSSLVSEWVQAISDAIANAPLGDTEEIAKRTQDSEIQSRPIGTI